MVLVRIYAVSLNYRDLLAVKGVYNPKLVMPRVPCSDGAGEVIAVGEGVREWKVGDRVCGIFMQNWQDGPLSAAKSKGALGGDVDGMLATEVVLAASGLVKIPEHLSYEEAATLPCAAVTAWNALFTATETKPGQTVLIQGTGGVSIFACNSPRWPEQPCSAPPAATRSSKEPRLGGSMGAATTVPTRIGRSGP